MLFQLENDAAQSALAASTIKDGAEKAQAELASIQKQREQQDALVKQGAVSSKLRDELMLREVALTQTVAQAQRLQKPNDDAVRASRERVGAFRRAVDGEGRLGVAQASADVARATLQSKRAEKAARTITASRALRVLSIAVAPGTMVKNGEPMMVLVADVPRTITAWLSEEDIRSVTIGNVVTLIPEDGTAVRQGIVHAIAAAVTVLPEPFHLGQKKFGRGAMVDVNDGLAPPTPGQLFQARFAVSSRSATP
jgi:multidrug resistance efflux pump